MQGVTCRALLSAALTTICLPMQDQVTVWYDGACPLCLREITFLQKLDSRDRIEFVDVATGPADNCPIDQSELLARFHVSENGELLSGAAAFAAMWRAIPILRPLGLLARNRTVLKVLERLYTVFLKHRTKLQRWFTARS